MAKNEIQRFAGLLGLRKRSSIYMGPNDDSGLWTIIREIGDNVLDITTKGWNKKGHIIADPDRFAFWVLDEGPGFPVKEQIFLDEKGHKEKLNTLYVATGLTHAGSNFDSDDISRGVNGIGQKISNAMSKKYSVWTCNKGVWYSIHYANAKLEKTVTKEKPPKLPFGLKPKKGSIVYIEPDMSLFVKGTKFDLDSLLQWATLSSYLVPQIELKYTNKKGKTKTFAGKGLDIYLTERLEETKATAKGKPFIVREKLFDIAIAFANAENNEVKAYTNGLLNSEGGEHSNTVYDALVKSLKPYKGKLDYSPKDLQDGLVGLINVKLPAPQFSGQVKEKLIDKRAKEVMAEPVLKAFEEFWKKNKSLAVEVSKRAAELRKLSDSFQQDKKMAKNIDSARKNLSSKLADISGSKVPFNERELFIVEGDSAAGGAKRARDKHSQAVLPFRGKPLNVMEAPKAKIQANVEFTTFFAALGVDLKLDDPFAKLRFGKILLFADADPDGHHITTLILAMLYKFAKPLLRNGNVYIVNAPIYKCRYKGKVYFGFTKQEIYDQTKTEKVDISYLKGLGECNDSDLKYFGMDPTTRKITQVSMGKSSKDFEALMGKDSAYRKQLMGIA